MVEGPVGSEEEPLALRSADDLVKAREALTVQADLAPKAQVYATGEELIARR